MAVTPAQRLRNLLSEPNVEVMPGCYDALSAKLVADAGYKVTFMSGFAVSAARLGAAGHRADLVRRDAGQRAQLLCSAPEKSR